MQPNASALAMVVMTILLFMLAMLGVGAWWAWERDPWLGALTAWWVVSLFWTRSALAFESVMLGTLGVVALVALQQSDPAIRHLAVRVALIGAVSQACLGLLQILRLDPIWSNSEGLALGTIGNTAYLACILAAFVPVVSWPLALVLLTTIALAHAKIAFLAAMVGLAVQTRRWGWLLVGTAGAVLIAYNVNDLMIEHAQSQWHKSASARLTIWAMALSDLSWTDWLIGRGPASWIETIPRLQEVRHVLPGAYMTWAHSEWVQGVYEGGVVEIVCVGGWLWAHRAMWQGAYAGSVAAMLVMSTSWFILHNANMALPLLVLWAAASAPPSGKTPDPRSQ